MALAEGQHTVLVFKQLQFRGSWTRMNGANAIIYTADSRPKLIVVTEDRAGHNVTYMFAPRVGDDVWVTYGGDAQVHIPRLCVSFREGNLARCE